MGVDGKFADVTPEDIVAFAENHGVPYAKKVVKEVKAALSRWPEFAARAGLPPEVSDGIEISFGQAGN
jgi:serine/threonine-protein kinase HipA